MNRIPYGFQTIPPPTNTTVHRNDRGLGHLKGHRRGHREEKTLQKGNRAFLVIEGLLRARKTVKAPVPVMMTNTPGMIETANLPADEVI